MNVPLLMYSVTSHTEQQRIVAYFDSFSLSRELREERLASHKGMILLRQLQSAMGEELRPLFFAGRTLPTEGSVRAATARSPRSAA
jgi:hypothetical protein